MDIEEYYNSIINSIDHEFKTKNKPQQSRIYIFWMIKSGIVLFEDCRIPSVVLEKLIKNGKVKNEQIDAFHQGEKCIRYRFLGYKYPNEYYRSISKSIREKVMDRDNYSCVNCGAYHRLTIDHIIPWSLGGETSYENLQVLCKSCNSKKSNK